MPAGTTYARFAMFDADVNPGSDIDLCVFKLRNTGRASSGGTTANETVNLVNPEAGTYTVVVHGCASVAGRLHAAPLAARQRLGRQHDGDGARLRDDRSHRNDRPELQRPGGGKRSTSARCPTATVPQVCRAPTIVRVDPP